MTAATSPDAVVAPTIAMFGKDHWSLFAYLETLCVDGQDGLGTIDRRRVRCNENTHPQWQVNQAVSWRPSYGTRLQGYFEFSDRANVEAAVAAGLQLPDHDDWDCLDDLERAGLIDIASTANGTARLTPAGIAVAAQLREHKIKGGMFASFKLDVLPDTSSSTQGEPHA